MRCNHAGDVEQIYNTDGTLAARYYYDSWGLPVAVKNASGVTITDAAHIANVNPIRCRGYYYDAESDFYYLQSRYYDPVSKRFMSADEPEYLGADGSPLSYNLFVYCGNNPANMYDPNGYCTIALAGGGYLATAGTAGVVNVWNPVGWVILGTLAVTTVVIVGFEIYDSIKSASKSSEADPYARPGQKKQGRERKNKARKNDNWKPRSNPKPPKKHTPGREHRKYN